MDFEICLMEEQEEVVEEANEGESVVLRRALSGLKGDKEEKWRTFPLKVHGPRESVLVDHRWREFCQCSLTYYGAQLASYNPSSPYNIQWLNQGKGLQVNL